MRILHVFPCQPLGNVSVLLFPLQQLGSTMFFGEKHVREETPAVLPPTLPAPSLHFPDE